MASAVTKDEGEKWGREARSECAGCSSGWGGNPTPFLHGTGSRWQPGEVLCSGVQDGGGGDFVMR
jgi:hypothetical protein